MARDDSKMPAPVVAPSVVILYLRQELAREIVARKGKPRKDQLIY